PPVICEAAFSENMSPRKVRPKRGNAYGEEACPDQARPARVGCGGSAVKEKWGRGALGSAPRPRRSKLELDWNLDPYGDGVPPGEGRVKAPPGDRFPRGVGQARDIAQHRDPRDLPVPAHEDVQHDAALDPLLARPVGIIGC